MILKLLAHRSRAPARVIFYVSTQSPDGAAPEVEKDGVAGVEKISPPLWLLVLYEFVGKSNFYRSTMPN